MHVRADIVTQVAEQPPAHVSESKPSDTDNVATAREVCLSYKGHALLLNRIWDFWAGAVSSWADCTTYPQVGCVAALQLTQSTFASAEPAEQRSASDTDCRS